MADNATDGLAQKLYEEWCKGRPEKRADVWPWDAMSPGGRSRWEGIAQLARAETMLLIATNFEALLKMTDGDPEQAPYRAGVQFMIETLRKTALGPS